MIIAGHGAVNLSHILDTVGEFIRYHQQIEDDAQVVEANAPRRTDFIVRLQTAMDDLRTAQ